MYNSSYIYIPWFLFKTLMNKMTKNSYNFFSEKIQKIFIKSCIILTFLIYFRFLNSLCPILIQYCWIVQYNKMKWEEEDKSWLKGKEGRKSVEEKREKAKGKESPFASHEILRLATNPGETMETESILRAGGHRCVADWHWSDREIEVSIFGKTRNCPPAFSSGSRFDEEAAYWLVHGPICGLLRFPVSLSRRTKEPMRFVLLGNNLENIAVS